MGKCKFCWVLTLLLAVMVAGMGYFFLIKGNSFVGEDGRTTIVLSEIEKASVLGEMRTLLEGVQIITGALAVNDLAAVAEAASSRGMVMANSDSPDLLAKLPLEVKTLGLGAHAAFDNLAAMANDGVEANILLGELSDMMSSCVACHQQYRIAIENFDE